MLFSCSMTFYHLYHDKNFRGASSASVQNALENHKKHFGFKRDSNCRQKDNLEPKKNLLQDLKCNMTNWFEFLSSCRTLLIIRSNQTCLNLHNTKRLLGKRKFCETRRRRLEASHRVLILHTHTYTAAASQRERSVFAQFTKLLREAAQNSCVGFPDVICL